MRTLMSKWIIQVIILSQSNLQFQSSYHGSCVHGLFGCCLLISPLKGVQKFGCSVMEGDGVNGCLSFPRHIYRMFCNLTFGGG